MSDQTPGVTPTLGQYAGAEKNIYKKMTSNVKNEVGDHIGDVNTTYASSKCLKYRVLELVIDNNQLFES